MHQQTNADLYTQTEWGTHSLTQASRLLLKAALANPLNQRFSLVCGASLPVRPPLFAYTQLLGESRSRFGVQQGHFIHAKFDEVRTSSAVGLLQQQYMRGCS